MTYTISIIKGNIVIFYVIFLVTVFLIFINNMGEDVDLIKLYYVLDGVLFYILYQLTCIVDSTWSLDDNTLSITGRAILFSKRTNDVQIPIPAIVFYKLNRRPYFNVFKIKLKSNIGISIPMVKYGNTQTEFARFMHDFELIYAKAKNTQ